VKEDGHLLFLYGNSECAEVARTMAGLTAMEICTASCDDSDVDGCGGCVGSMMRMYLKGVEVKLKELISLLTTDASVHTETGEESEDRVEAHLSHTLSAAVSLLHRTIADIYVLFFLRPAAQLSSTAKGSTIPPGFVLPGLFGQTLQKCLESLIMSFDKGKIPSDWTKETSRKLLQGLFSESALLSTWKDWIAAWTEAIQDACVQAFSHMKSATEIAHIQRATLHACMNCNTGATTIGMASLITTITLEGKSSSSLEGPDCTDNGHMAMAGWCNACILLLPSNALSAAYTTHNPQTSSDDMDSSPETMAVGGLLLWSTVFRRPFITQVEHLLKVSCHDVFNRTRKRLLRNLMVLGNHCTNSHSTQGLTCRMRIHAVTLDISFDMISTPSSDGTSNVQYQNHNGEANTLKSTNEHSWEWIDAYTSHGPGDHSYTSGSAAGSGSGSSGVTAAKSGEIFMRAEKIRLFLDSEISSLVKELISPVRLSNATVFSIRPWICTLLLCILNAIV
jgi:hypothetical protein